MSLVIADISVSLDGYVAGPNDRLGHGLGDGGEPIHNWIMGGDWTSGDEPFASTGVDRQLLEGLLASTGAAIVGRRMWDVVDGWGDKPPWSLPVFVLTHRGQPTESRGATTYTFVTDGPLSALEQAKATAGDRNVLIAGGASVVQQYFAEGVIDELRLHISPVLLGAGRRLWENLGSPLPGLEQVKVIESPLATHIRYRVTPHGRTFDYDSAPHTVGASPQAQTDWPEIVHH
ncbi:MAG: deaminase/reductase [Microbacteriaceae bacterium]|nr:deaminase/reductase [Microbacteriaceae bacterium]